MVAMVNEIGVKSATCIEWMAAVQTPNFCRHPNSKAGIPALPPSTTSQNYLNLDDPSLRPLNIYLSDRRSMVGGNGWVGMPHAHVSAASSMRSGATMALAAAMESSSDVLHLPVGEQPRLPSTRPIDRRWDRSRGIVFHHSKRPTTRTYTWNVNDGITFAPFSSTSRSYARRDLGRSSPPSSTPKPSPTEEKSGSMLENTHAAASFGSANAATINDLRAQKGALERDQAEKAATIRRLEEKISSLQKDQSALESQKAELAEELHREQQATSVIRKEFDEKEAGIEKALRDEKERVDREVREEKARVDREINEAKLQLDQRLDEMRRESDPEKRENDKVLNAVRREGYEHGKRDMHTELQQRELEIQSQMQSQREGLQSEIDEEKSVTDALRVELTEKTAELNTTTAQLRGQIEHGELMEKKYNNAMAESDRKKLRGEQDRKNYGDYRSLWNEFNGKVYPVYYALSDLGRNATEKAQLWKKSSETYRKSKELFFFRQAGKFTVLDKAISDYLDAKHTQALEEAETLSNLQRQLINELMELKGEAHFSRALTRYHHLPRSETVFTAASLAEQVANVSPIRKQHIGSLKLVDKLRNKLKSTSASASEREETATQLDQAVSASRFWSRQVDVAESMRKYHAYKALLHASPVEKRVFTRTHRLYENVNQMEDQLESVDESGGAGGKISDSSKDLRKSKRVALAELDAYSELVREHALLEENLNLFGEKDAQRYDSVIESNMMKFKRDMEMHVKEISPLLHEQRRALARETSLRSPSKVQSLQALRGSLINKIGPTVKKSTMKQRVAAISAMDSAKRQRMIIVWREEMDSHEKAKQKHSAENAPAKVKESEKQIGVLENKIALAEQLETELTTSTQERTSEETQQSRRTETRPRGRLHRLSKMRAARAARSSTNSVGPTTTMEALRTNLSEATAGGGLGLKPTEPRQAIHSPYSLGAIRCWGNAACSSLAGTSQTFMTSTTQGRSPSAQIASTPMQSPGSRQDAESPSSHMILVGRRLSSISLADDHAPSHIASAGEAHAYRDQIQSSNNEDPDANPPDGAPKLDTATDDEQSNELDYQISPRDLRAAAMASQNSNASFWSHTLYKGKEGKKPVVYYCTDFAKAEERAKLFVNEAVLGFDLEWEMHASLKKQPIDIKQNVSLIQIASEDKIGLFQVALFKGNSVQDLLPPTLRQILESPTIAKTGVNIVGDARRVKACMGVDMQGVFELSYLYTLVKFSARNPEKVNFKLVSLASQVENVLLLPLKKDSTRTSAWSHRLNTQQTDYAASDAYAGFQLYHKLEKERKALSPRPQRPAFSELDLPMVLGNGSKVYKFQKKSFRKERTEAAAEVAAENSEDDGGSDEFLNAAEEIDPYELGASRTASSTAGAHAGTSHGPAQSSVAQEVSYPDLAALDLPSDADVAASLETNDEVDQPPPEEEADFATANEAADSTSRGRKVLHPDSDETKLADAWVAKWRASLPPDYNIVGRPRELCAWHLWHEQGHSMEEVAALLKDPPLVMTTVASYILQSIKAENLPYDENRVKEVLRVLPKVARARYWRIVKDVEDG